MKLFEDGEEGKSNPRICSFLDGAIGNGTVFQSVKFDERCEAPGKGIFVMPDAVRQTDRLEGVVSSDSGRLRA